MDVDAAEPGHSEDVRRQQLPIRRYHDELRLQLPQNGQGGPVPQGLRLIDGDIAGQGTGLHRGGLELIVVPAHRPVRLAEHANHLMPRLRQSLQGGDGKFWGAHEDDSHLLRRLLLLPWFSSSDRMASISSEV